MTTSLIPPDLKQCQAEKPNGHTFLTLGGSPGLIRCEEKPIYVVKEYNPGKDGETGSMSLCSDCYRVFLKQMEMDYAFIQQVIKKQK